jgi:hypothetical protein
MKKLTAVLMIVLISGTFSSFGQNKDLKSSGQKNDQVNLNNDFYISYGTGSVFYFIDNEGMTANSMSGTFTVGFSRSLNQVIAVGFQMHYIRIDRTGNNYLYSSYPPTTTKEEMTDNLWEGIANVRFRYLNRPSFCMYSGIGMGVTMDFYQKTYDNSSPKGQKLLPAAQLTLLGFRVGRALSFFGEFGVGTSNILNAGISYKFGE